MLLFHSSVAFNMNAGAVLLELFSVLCLGKLRFSSFLRGVKERSICPPALVDQHIARSIISIAAEPRLSSARQKKNAANLRSHTRSRASSANGTTTATLTKS